MVYRTIASSACTAQTSQYEQQKYQPLCFLGVRGIMVADMSGISRHGSVVIPTCLNKVADILPSRAPAVEQLRDACLQPLQTPPTRSAGFTYPVCLMGLKTISPFTLTIFHDICNQLSCSWFSLICVVCGLSKVLYTFYRSFTTKKPSYRIISESGGYEKVRKHSQDTTSLYKGVHNHSTFTHTTRTSTIKSLYVCRFCRFRKNMRSSFKKKTIFLVDSNQAHTITY